MNPSARRSLLTLSALLMWQGAAELRAQVVERFPGVELGLEYVTGRRPVLAIPPINVLDGRDALAATIQSIFETDFENSDGFTVLGALPGATSSMEVDYRFWDQQRADWLLVARLEPTRGTSLYLELHDVVFNRVNYAAVYDLGDPESPGFRMRVHVASDELFEKMTGEIGIAASRIAFSIREDSGRQEIWVIDSDGENLTRLTDHAATVGPGELPPISLAPGWSPDGLSLVYSSSATPTGDYRIRERVLATASDRVLDVGRQGQFYAPKYLGDGRIVFSGYTGQQSAIMVYDAARDCCLESIATGRLETSLTASPDGRSVAWESARLGPSQIYTRSVGGSGRPQILSPYRSDGNKYHAPDWSPDGNRMAFHGELSPGVFQVVVGELGRGGRFIQITDAKGRNESNEDPSWAPDSRHLTFVGTRRDGVGLYVMATMSGRIRRIIAGRRISLPAWSPAIRAGGGEE